MEKVYNPSYVEEKWIDRWQKSKIFSPNIDKTKKPFTVVIPPPNITGALHMGHALNNTLQDIIVRYHRMKGENTYWVVGTDHGGIATQNVMEKILKKENVNKNDIGRENFLKRMWSWYRECGDTILNQLKKLGCSIDFSKENVRFTMDEERTKAVISAFYQLWKNDLIYRGKRMINWCPRCYTALSDIEVEYEEEKSKLWYIRYYLEDKTGYIVVATTRPETMLGDTAVCVNPLDERYKNLIGKYLILPIVGRKIKVIADERIDMGFGTGAVKITPAHDPLDYEIAQKHFLDLVVVISDDGRMINCPDKYLGMKIFKAREEIVGDLKNSNLIEKEEDYVHNVGKCYRCNSHIEPLVSEQWFVKTKPLAQKAIEVINSNKIEFYPEKWKKMLLEWLINIEDWCISRQIWWGHRIPAYYCKTCSNKGIITNSKGEVVKIIMEKGAKPIVSEIKPANCPECGSIDLVQDPDVLDTWFSSALWPFSVFGWPKQTEQLKYFYPTSVLVTGYEILYLWVARMIMSGLFHMNEIPFSKVYVHGIVRDRHGQKMSKSKGNVIDPLEIMQKYGTDAMRFTLAINAGSGKDIPFSENSIVGGRNFINKLYNVSRFLFINIKDEKENELQINNLDLSDKWILSRLYNVYSNYQRLMNEYMLSEALDLIYGFVWDEFCDWYIELSKIYLSGNERIQKISIILNVIKNSIKMLHPFIPFVTQEIYDSLKKYINENFEFITQSHIYVYNFYDQDSVKNMEVLMEIIKEIRTLRSEFSIHPAKEINVIISSNNDDNLHLVKDYELYIKHLAKIKNIDYSLMYGVKTIRGFAKGCQIYIIVENDMDADKQKIRIAKEIESLKISISKWKSMLSNSKFIEKAPQSEVNRIEELVKENTLKLDKLKEMISEL
ncbi:MAG: valine--tRNA ligase [Elusimicrobiales bacterium]|nr:valine--tRNA ligase [Elusimicrobiales bacterium]